MYMSITSLFVYVYIRFIFVCMFRHCINHLEKHRILIILYIVSCVQIEKEKTRSKRKRKTLLQTRLVFIKTIL